MVSQVTTLHRVRLPIIAVAAFALGLLTAVAAPHVTIGAPQSATQAPVIAQPALPQVRAETLTCGRGAYVTGDLVGDASPAAVYGSMCGGR